MFHFLMLSLRTKPSLVSPLVRLAPNEFHLGRLPRFPIVLPELGRMAGNYSLECDQHVYCDLVGEHHLCAYD